MGWVCMSTQPHQYKVTQSDSVEPKSTQPHQHKVTLDWVGLRGVGLGLSLGGNPVHSSRFSRQK